MSDGDKFLVKKKLDKLYSFLQVFSSWLLGVYSVLKPVNSVDQPKSAQQIFCFAAQNFSPSPGHPALVDYGHQERKGRSEGSLVDLLCTPQACGTHLVRSVITFGPEQWH